MRSSALVLAALAMNAIASPMLKRAIEVDLEVVYVTHTIVITGEPPAATPPPQELDESSVGLTPKPEEEESHSPSYVPVVEEEEPEPVPQTPTYGNTYKESCLNHHNMHRANHSVAALEWSDELAATAERIGATCVYEHNTEMDGGGYGQNIAAGVKSEEISVVITNLFYNGELNAFMSEFGKPQPDMTHFKVWGHLTQIIWKDTTAVGCATVDCSGRGLAKVGSNVPPLFTVCNYKGPGNYAGEYDKNVFPPLGEPTAYGSSIA